MTPGQRKHAALMEWEQMVERFHRSCIRGLERSTYDGACVAGGRAILIAAEIATRGDLDNRTQEIWRMVTEQENP